MILAGGIGSRFWPASTPRRPKQLLPLVGPRPLIRDTVDRALSLVPGERVRILAGAHLVAPFREALGQVDDPQLWVEPQARGTGPVLAWAAHRLVREDPDAVMVSLHSDHFIAPPEAFRARILEAARLARDSDLLFTIAVRPGRPETGYGYLRPGPSLEASVPAWRVDAFVEKPDPTTAARYLAEGYLWNSGIFVWSAARFLEEVRAHAPEIADHLHLLETGDVEGFFREVTPISVDEAVLERSGRVGAVEAGFRWDDVGDWNALARTGSADDSGNVVEGSGWVVDARGNVVWAEDGPVVVFGADDLVVARSGGITMVAPREKAAALKELVRRLPESLRSPPSATVQDEHDDASAPRGGEP